MHLSQVNIIFTNIGASFFETKVSLNLECTVLHFAKSTAGLGMDFMISPWLELLFVTHFLTSSRYQVLLLLAIVLKGKDRHTDIAQTNASFETCHEKNESNSQLQNMYCHTSGYS